ncbi:cadherin domain-containing protein [Dolichospermum sp. LEGE 00246]|uniref:cadherin domain-containing protein n=1 Tax=Dolichospermum sp. LEGE 00246 TaxID=1828605 RepID=UPI001881C6A4|nr:cadherin domain-containing protein [Dolichospermum sp. LEGE 00246]MBE9256142.1 cadherin domain-containing protein [Dolichospermum sp. LEGE 00246]
MAFSIKVQLFADNGSVIGGAVDSVIAGNSFYAQILVGDFRSDPFGLIGFSSSIEWNPSILESLDDPFNPDTVVTANFPAVFGGTLDNTLGRIGDLEAGALPAFDLGQAIGVDKLEPFATLHFLAKVNVTASDFVLIPNLSGLAFTDDYVNNAPLIPTPGAFLENSNNIILTVSELNPQDTLTFAITGGVDQSLFTLDPATGQLTFNNIPDFENPIDSNQDNIYEVQITAHDNFGEPATTTLRGLTVSALNIQVANVNETPTNLILSNTSINENVPLLTVVGNFSTTDPDAGNTFTYTLISGAGDTDNHLFTINSNQLKISASPDFETKSSYSILVKTTDQGGLSYEKQLTINVNDLNEAPTSLTLSNNSINENVALLTVIGDFSATDPDAGNTLFTYSLVNGTGDTDNNVFTISSNQLKINASPNFETKNSYNIRVKTTDQGGLSYEKQLTINVNDLNETPTNLILSNTSINENVASLTVIGDFSTTDVDVGNTFTYTLISGAGDTDNNVFTIGSNQLKINASPDFETKNSYNIRVKTTDQGGLSYEKQLTIGVNNVNETPTNLILSNTSINENVPLLTVVGNFSTTDPDAGNTFSYSLVNGAGDTDNNVFTISSNQLKINASPDFETKNSYSIRVKTTDQGGLSHEKQLTIGVNDLNEIIGNPSINNGRNPIVGTAVSDYIIGGPGAKTITGGAGNDLFVFTDLRDVGQRITDFTVGGDKIVLTKLVSSISYNGTNPIADKYIRFVAGTGSNTGSTFLQIDRDGISGSAIFKNFLQVDNITTTQLNNVDNFVF